VIYEEGRRRVEDQVEVVIVSGGELFCRLAAALPLECVDGSAGQSGSGR
jgi:hypothetical protein